MVSPVRRAISRGLAAAALTLALAALAAPAAQAGQVVWVAAVRAGGGALLAANDDGTYPHQLLNAGSTGLALMAPDGTIADPDTFQLGGTSVVFTDAMSAWNAPAGAAQCAEPCTRTYSLSGGVLSSDSPMPAPAGVSVESQPRLAPGGNLVEYYALYPNATPAALGAASMAGLFERSAGASFADPWANTATDTLAALPDPAPDPAAASLVAWVADEGCTTYELRGSPVCQYAVHVAPEGDTSRPPVAIFDDESPGGGGPSSLSWSSNGRELLLVDDQPPNDGIYEVASTTSVAPGTKTVTELISEPPGWTFGQARFAGSHVIFSAAGEGESKESMSDIYSISANCNSGTCAFPLNATNLTNNPAADNVDPAWTSATAPLPPLGDTSFASAPVSIDAAKIVARTVTPTQGVAFEVTLSRAGSLSVSISRDGHTIGTTTERLPAGASTFTIKQSGGHALTAGQDDAKLRLSSSTTIHYSTAFTVK
jgi:hypothetical protein